MANVNVTYQELQDAATKLGSGQSEIETNLSALSTLVQGLITSGFVTDSSSVQFGQSYDEFNKGATQTIAGLAGMASYLNTAAQTFQDVDTQLGTSVPHHH